MGNAVGCGAVTRADARRRAEEALRYDHDHANSPEVRRRLRGAVEALLAAGPEAKAPREYGPCPNYREGQSHAGCNLCGGLGTLPILSDADIAPPPPSDAVREAAERLVHKIDEVNASTAYIGIWDFAAQHGIRYDGPRFVGELDALRAALSRPAAKGGE